MPDSRAISQTVGTATVIASQARISGAFSLIRQAVQLGYFPRVEIRHAVARQIDLPFLAANLSKFAHGGYIPVLIAVALLGIMLVWRKGHALVAQYQRRCPELTEFFSGLKPQMAIRVPGAQCSHRAGFDRPGHLAPPRQAQPRACTRS